MGKKPVVGLIGLMWAGIALTGCGKCCQNCRTQNNAPPAYGARTTSATTPPMIGDARTGGTRDSGTALTGGTSRPGDHSAIQPAGGPLSPTSGGVTQAGGVMPSGGTTAIPTTGSPTTQESLSPTTAGSGLSTPASTSGMTSIPGHSDALPTSTSRPAATMGTTSSRQGYIPPARPVTSISGSSAMPAAPLPPNGGLSPSYAPDGRTLPPLGSSSSGFSQPTSSGFSQPSPGGTTSSSGFSHAPTGGSTVPPGSTPPATLPGLDAPTSSPSYLK